VHQNENVVKIGDDIKKGELVLKKGTQLSSRHIGALAAVGAFEISVFKVLKVVIISTGDELIDTDKPIKIGQVYDINTHTLTEHAKQLGFDVIRTHVINDVRERIKDAIQKGIKDADLVLISGGSSVGPKDYTAELIEELSGQPLLLHGLAIKPGKPTIVGKSNKTAVFGLPGHPVSALIVFDQLARFFLNGMYDASCVKTSKKLSMNLHAAPGKKNICNGQHIGRYLHTNLRKIKYDYHHVNGRWLHYHR
jgi:molybdopterin molybdotransferase